MVKYPSQNSRTEVAEPDGPTAKHPTEDEVWTNIQKVLVAIDANVRSHGYDGPAGSGLLMLLETTAAHMAIPRLAAQDVLAPAPKSGMSGARGKERPVVSEQSETNYEAAEASAKTSR